MATKNRKVEVFSAGCSVCDPVVELVQSVACGSCDVTVHNLKESAGAARAQEAGVLRVPTVLIDGVPAACCSGGSVTKESLRAAGIG